MSVLTDKANIFDGAEKDLSDARISLEVLTQQLSDAQTWIVECQKRRDVALADLQSAIKGMS